MLYLSTLAILDEINNMVKCKNLISFKFMVNSINNINSHIHCFHAICSMRSSDGGGEDFEGIIHHGHSHSHYLHAMQ